MAYVNVDKTRCWRLVTHSVDAPQIVEITVPTTKTYVAMDFSAIVADPVVAISTVATPTETAGKTITLAEEATDPTNRIVSFSVAGMAAGDYEIKVEATLSEGTDNNVSGRGLLRVV